jgi:hypothetical protein
MATPDTVEDAWMETCLVTISKIGGSDMEFAALTETVDFDLGEKDIEGIALVNGGRVAKWNPEGDSTITLEAYPIQAGTDTGSKGEGFFDLMHSDDGSHPIRFVNDRNRDKVRILCLWSTGSETSAAEESSANAQAIRLGLAEAYVTSVKPSFTDGILKFTITIKAPAFDKSGDGNVLAESVDGSTTLPAIAAYTTENKFG